MALALVAGMVLAAALLASGCGGGSGSGYGGGASNGSSTDHPPVIGTGWLMVSYSKPGGIVEMHQGVRLPSLEFKKNNTVQVFDGCNSGGGKAVVNDDGTIKFGPVMTTLMGCPAGTEEVSSAIQQVLQGTADYSFEGGNLVLKNGDETLTYSAGDSGQATPATTADLQHHTFESTAVHGHVINPDSNIDLAFERQTLTVTAGCGRQWGKFTVQDGVMKTGFEDGSGLDCSMDDHRQNNWIRNYLADGANVRMDGDKFSLTNGDETTIDLEKTGDTPVDQVDDGLTDTTWTLARLTDPDGAIRKVPRHGEKPTLTFYPDDRTSFYDGCNGGSSKAKLGDRGILFSGGVSTMVGCFGPDKWVETTFKQVISGLAKYRLSESQLLLMRGRNTLILTSD